MVSPARYPFVDESIPSSRRSQARRPWDRADDGFTLIEVAVAMVIAAIFIAGLTMTLASSVGSTQQNRTVEQAAALAIEQVEFVRSLTWDELLMDDWGHGGPHVVNPPPFSEIVGIEVGLPSNEPLAVDTHDGLVPYETFETLDEQQFVVRNYVTDAGPGLRRLIVVVSWQAGPATRSHQTTTLIAEAATAG